MNDSFAEVLRRLRTKKGLSQQQLAEKLFVDRSTVASWESGRRLPSAPLVTRISECLEADPALLLEASSGVSSECHVILVDDETIILNGNLPILREALPGIEVAGFTRPSAALDYASSHRVALAFLDIEMGKFSGIDLSRELLKINPRTNVVFLTAYPEYALDAWATGASGFLLKPLTKEAVLQQLAQLRYPERGLVTYE